MDQQSPVGRRPGEKIQEQLWRDDARVVPTDFERVLAVHAESIPEDFPAVLQSLESAARSGDSASVVAYLERMPIEFTRDGRPAAGAATV